MLNKTEHNDCFIWVIPDGFKVTDAFKRWLKRVFDTVVWLSDKMAEISTGRTVAVLSLEQWYEARFCEGASYHDDWAASPEAYEWWAEVHHEYSRYLLRLKGGDAVTNVAGV